MSSVVPITLYDIPSRNAAYGNTWSPNMWKTRYALNFKGLPHKTSWVAFPDVAEKMKSIGAPPSDKAADGSPIYTCPTLSDPNPSSSSPALITDSWLIALYLDKTYPSASATLFPASTALLQETWIEKYETLAIGPVEELLVGLVSKQLSDASIPYFVETREKAFGKPIDAFCPPGPERDAALAAMQEGLGKVAELLDKNGDGGEKLFCTGDEPVYADLVFASSLIWIKIVAEEEVWSKVKSWHGGRWERLLDAVHEKYGKVY
ncbi:hypothetical protein SISSUDRAFT_993108 [Sistotremastrum suecicum HHB10207 ss-3]|uniref:GST N-terminal domain-containing protein n=1 Tax=Sistotremastrum suecicum HHB10207 ss-3 TaxID=1314776 RepID=A0A165YLW2_9AGAM|nr:hypothetical protein SISSUDRAFT_993108 [Sistotremastrum suecicum HHB10207 ss-3]